MQIQPISQPILHKRIAIPPELLASAEVGGKKLTYGGDVRMGDLTGDGKADFVVFRSAEGGIKPCFLAAFTMEGKVLWRDGQGGGQPVRPGSVAVHDIDADGAAEVICFFREPRTKSTPRDLRNVVLQIRDGRTGKVTRQAAPKELRSRTGHGANWVHQRILIANFRCTKRPRDLAVKLGETVLAFDEDLRVLWTYRIRWNAYGSCSAYIPAVGDIDGDGRDEVNGGYYLLGADGKPRWEKQLGRHMDSVAIAEWDGGKMRAICSGYGHVLDERGRVVLSLGKDVVPHGQEARVGNFLPSLGGPAMVIRYNGHARDVLLVTHEGKVLNRWRVNGSPNHTGMETVRWNGPKGPDLLYNGGVLWYGSGRRFAGLPGLPGPVGPSKMGWYHCIPADVCGDGREEVVLYNPWDKFVWIYTPRALVAKAFKRYSPGPRQWNVRLMD